MAQVSLKKILRDEAFILLKQFLLKQFISAHQDGITVLDVDGKVLFTSHETELVSGDRYPICADDEIVGWVAGIQHGPFVASFLNNLAARELERKTLAKELLDKYREINLVCNIATKLSHCMSLETIANLAIAEAQRLMKATSSAVFLLDRPTGILKAIAASGNEFTLETVIPMGEGPIGYIAAQGKAEVIDDVGADPRFPTQPGGMASLVCSSLRIDGEVTGAIALSHTDAVAYTAGDLQLLSAIGSQVAPAVEKSIRHEQEIREAQAREELLRRQVEELKIEIDQTKRQRQVAEITESEGFLSIQSRAERLRQKKLLQLSD